MRYIKIKVEYKDHNKVILTNSNGDTYTSKSEELMDFLHGLKPLTSISLSEQFNIWAKETKRNGGVLIGSSIKEFFKWVEDRTGVI